LGGDIPALSKVHQFKTGVKNLTTKEIIAFDEYVFTQAVIRILFSQ